MKKIYLLLLAVFCFSATISAQNISNYIFSTNSNGSFALDMNGNAVDMSTGTTQLIAPSVLDGSGSGLVNIGFDFWVMGVRNTQFSVSANGWLGIGVALTGSGNGWLGGGTAGNPRVAPFLVNTTAAGINFAMGTSPSGKVHYKIVGTAPNRTLVIEYLNMTIANPVTGSTTVDATFQARIYEATGVIEFVYGSMKVSGAANIFGNIGFSNTATVYHSTTTATHTSSTTTSTNLTYPPGTITDLNSVADGSRRYYRYTPTGTTAPTNLTFTSVGAVGMTLNWNDNASDELGYAVYRSSDGGATWTYLTTTAANAVSYAATGLNPSTSYQWRVTAIRESHSTALAGTQSTTAPGTVSSVATGNWSVGATWSTGVVPSAGDNVTISSGHTVTVDINGNAYNLTVDGNLIYEATTARTLTVGGDVTVSSAGTFKSAASGTQTGHILSLGGNLTNNGIIDFSTAANAAQASITFTGSANNTWTSGASSTTNLRQTTGVTINKGTSTSSILTYTPNGTLTVLSANTVGFLTITNGLFVLAGSNVFNNPLFNAAAYTIPATGGFQLNNANATVVGQNGSPTMSGLLRITNGTFNVGTAAGNAMGGAATSSFIFEGGTSNFSGRLNVTSAGAQFNMSAGTINITTVGNASSATAGFGFTSATSVFTMTGGTINLVQRATGATILDYNVATTAPTITGGTLNVGTAATVTNFNFGLQGAMPNVVIDNTTNSKTAQLNGAATAYGDVTVTTGATLNLNGFNLTLRGLITNNGTVTANATGSGLTFQGSAAQTLNGTITSSQVSNVTINNSAGVTIAPATQINTALTLTSGALSGGTITLGNAGANNFTYTATNGSYAGTFTRNYGTGTNNFIYNGTTAAQTTGSELPPSVATGTLTINNTNGVTLNSPFSIQNLALTAGKLTTTSANLLTVSGTTAGSVTGGSATAYVNGPLARTLPASLVTGTTYTWPIGKGQYQLFELLNATTSAAGTIVTQAEVFDANPAGTYTGFSSLTNNRYWQIAPLTGAGAFTSMGQVRLTETGMTGSTKIGQAVNPTPNGTYSNVGGTVAGSTITSVSTLTSFGTGANSTYFITGPAIPFAFGKYAIGPGGPYTAPEGSAYLGTYPTLTAAFTAINNAGVPSGNSIFELQNDYVSTFETFPLTPSYQGTASATLTIRPRSDIGAGTLTITSTNTAATLSFSGASYVIFDGRPGGGLGGSTRNLNIINTDATNVGVSIRFLNDSKNNTINYCDVQGQNTTSPANPAIAQAGVIYFGPANTLTLTGNDNNSVTNCNIHASGATLPAVGVLASSNATPGTDAAYNDGGKINNNNIYDFFSAAGASTGVKLDVGSNAWEIKGNHFYQTATRTATAGNAHRAIWVTPGTSSTTTANGFDISNNFIGGAAPNAAGSPWTIAGAFATVMWGMDISVGLGTATSVQNNTLTNLNITTTATTSPAGFMGISQNQGNVNIGNVTGNVIGSTSSTGAITVTTTSATTALAVYGYRVTGGTSSVVNVSNNSFGSITTVGSGTVSLGITGIHLTAGTTLTINNNTIGSTSTANSLNASSSTTGAQSVIGINVATTTAGTISITNNTIANLNNNYTSTGTGNVNGILIASSATPTISAISGNTVRNLSSASTGTGTGASAAIGGIVMQNTNAAGCNVTGNTIHSLSLTSASTTAATFATGLYYTGTASVVNTISKNFIHSFDVTAANPNTTLSGMDFGSATSTVTIANNMIRLGIRPNGTDLSTEAIIRGIAIVSTGATNIWFNSVYIGGVNVGSAVKNTFAFTRTGTSGTYDIRDNIFSNVRSNAGAGGKHYALFFTTATTGATTNYNLYQNTGSGGIFAFNGSADVASYSAGWLAGDNNSIVGDPLFAAPLGDAVTVNLHIKPGTPAEGAGTLIASVTDDFDGDIRANFTPTDIGADAGDYALAGLDLGVTGLIAPALTGCFTNTETVTVTLKNFSSTTINFATNNATVNVNATGPGGYTYSSSVLLNSGSLAANTSMNVTMPATADLSVNGIYTFNSNVSVAGDVNPANDAMAATTRTSLTLNGTYTVGASGANYTTLTAAVADYNSASCITAPVVFELQNNYSSTGETFPITINANAVAGTNTLTIQPAGGVAATITGSSATSILKLNGADYIIIDGLNTGGSSLTVENTSATAGTATIWLASAGTGAGATNNIIRNTSIKAGIAQNGSTSNTYGVVIAGNTLNSTITSITAGDDNDNNTITGNTFTKVRYAIHTRGGSTTNPNLGTLITNNIIGPTAFGTDQIGKGGIISREEDGIQIRGNEIRFVGGTYANITAGTDRAGIGLCTDATWTPTSVYVKNAVITNNRIHDIVDERTFSAVGIQLAGVDGTNPTNNLVANNMMYNLLANGTGSDQAIGVGLSTGNGDKVVYNSIYMTGDTDPNASATTTAISSFGISISSTSVTNPLIKDNLVYMDLTSSSAPTLKNAAINIPASYVWGTGSSNYNDFFVQASNTQANIGCVGGSGGTFYATLSAWQTAVTQDANSLNVMPVFVSASDLHLVPGSNATLDNFGNPVAGVTTDIDGDTRSSGTAPNGPDMGADEFTAPACTGAVGGTAVTTTPNLCVSGTPAITASGYSTGIGSTYQWQSSTNLAFTTPVDIAGQTNPASLTVPAITATTYYRLKVTCTSGTATAFSNVVTITVNALPTVSVSPAGPVTICAPSSQLLTATTNASSPTYQWKKDGSNVGTNSSTYSATASGSYTVTVTDGSTTCSNTSAPVVVTVNAQPSAVTITPSSVSMCAEGNAVQLTASGSTVNGTIISENFNGVTAGTTTSGNLPAGWTGASLTSGVRIWGVVASAQSGSTIGGGNFLYCESDLYTTFQTRAEVITPAFDASGYSSISIKFKQYYNDLTAGAATDSARVYISNDGGATWTSIQEYDTDQGTAFTAVGAVNTTIAVPGAITLTNNMKVRLVYNSDAGGNDWYWAVDDFIIDGPQNLNYTWSALPGLYTDAAAATAYTGTATTSVYAKPSSTTTYTATATSSLGCTNSNTVVVTVTPPASPNGLAGTAGGAKICNSITIPAYGMTVADASCNIIGKIVPSGASPVSGSVNTCVTVDASVQTYLGQQYVQRHYDIEPATTPATATATLTLYFTQAEFDAFNAANGSYPDLPTGPSDNTGKSNLHVIQYHGVATGPSPANYPGPAVAIDPADANIVWNAAANRWEVTFNVIGFSGFYVTTGALGPLPVTFTTFNARRNGSVNDLTWSTSQEINTSHFVVERSTDGGRTFAQIGQVAAAGNSNTLRNYQFTDISPIKGTNYYRLRITDRDNNFKYSDVRSVKNTGNADFAIYPNPVQDVMKVEINADRTDKGVMIITDVSGKQVYTRQVNVAAGNNIFSVDISNIAQGAYIIKVQLSDDMVVKKFNKM